MTSAPTEKNTVAIPIVFFLPFTSQRYPEMRTLKLTMGVQPREKERERKRAPPDHAADEDEADENLLSRRSQPKVRSDEY